LVGSQATHLGSLTTQNPISGILAARFGRGGTEKMMKKRGLRQPNAANTARNEGLQGNFAPWALPRCPKKPDYLTPGRRPG
jgi:hypothetical protein